MKKTLLTTILISATTALFAQNTRDKVFYLDSLHKVTNEKNYDYTRIVEDYNSKKNLYNISEYYKSGNIRMSAVSKNKNNLQLEGLRIDYYENGNKKQQSNYIDNKLSGKQFSWYDNNEKKSEKEISRDIKNKTSETKILQFWNPDGKQTVTDGNGQIEEIESDFLEKGEVKNGKKEGIWTGKNTKSNNAFTENYKNGKITSGISTDTNNNKFPYKEIMDKPIPTKGMTHFFQHVAKNFKAPQVPGLNGKVHVTFVIDKDGSITDIKVLKDLGYDTKQEAINTVSSYGKWTPGKIRGVPVRVMYSLPISVNNGNSNNQ